VGLAPKQVRKVDSALELVANPSVKKNVSSDSCARDCWATCVLDDYLQLQGEVV